MLKIIVHNVTSKIGSFLQFYDGFRKERNTFLTFVVLNLFKKTVHLRNVFLFLNEYQSEQWLNIYHSIDTPLKAYTFVAIID